MNGTECRPQAPVAEGGPNVTANAPKTLFLFLATPYPLRQSEGDCKMVRVADRGATGLVPRGPGE